MSCQERILVVEDDQVMTENLILMLRREGYQTEAVDTAERAFAPAVADRYALMILDLVLPDIRGDELLRRLRARGSDVPTLVLSALDSVEAKVRCLAAGADDYMTKPFERHELLARIRAILRRAQHARDQVLRIGRLQIDLRARVLSVKGIVVPLTSREFQVLELLASRKGAPVSKKMFLDRLYGERDVPSQKVIEVFVCKLRRKLAAATGGEDHIETVWGAGYRLQPPRAWLLPVNQSDAR